MRSSFCRHSIRSLMPAKRIQGRAPRKGSIAFSLFRDGAAGALEGLSAFQGFLEEQETCLHGLEANLCTVTVEMMTARKGR